MGFEPPKAITLHLIVFKVLESIVWQGFYTYSASPSLIQEIETKFQTIKAAKESELAPKLNLAKTSTGNLQVKIQDKVNDPELNNAIAKTITVLANNKPIVKDEIETLKQENEALASTLPGKLQQLNLPEQQFQIQTVT